jgi:hypothetical protein
MTDRERPVRAVGRGNQAPPRTPSTKGSASERGSCSCGAWACPALSVA